MWIRRHNHTDPQSTHLVFFALFLSLRFFFSLTKRVTLVQKTHKHTPHIFQCVPFAFYDLWFMDSTIYLSRLKVTFLFMHSKICDTPSHLKHSFFRFVSFRCAHRTCVIFNDFFSLKHLMRMLHSICTFHIKNVCIWWSFQRLLWFLFLKKTSEETCVQPCARKMILKLIFV